MSAAVQAFDTAYPGSMSERTDGRYIRRDDPVSVAAALLEMIANQQREIEDLKALAASPEFKAAPDLLAALRKLTLMARTSGGTAGPDSELMAACAAAETVIAKATGEAP